MLAFIEKVMEARSVEEVWTVFVDKMGEFGFERLIYAHSLYKTERGFGDLQDIVLLTTQTQEYMKEFIDNGLYLHAPMVNWGRENVGACSWRWIAENMENLSPQELKVVDFNKRMGVVAGFSIAFRETNTRSKGGLALTAREGLSQTDVDAIWDEHGRNIEAMSWVAHVAMTTLPRAHAPRMLTARQREALQWVGDGKTTQDIAVLMGLTPATVEKHLRLAREQLNAETTAQAVLKASVINQIYVVDGW